jgi:hypothetical protein
MRCLAQNLRNLKQIKRNVLFSYKFTVLRLESILIIYNLSKVNQLNFSL